MTVEAFIEKYKDFFMASNMDVCHSIKGKWYIYAYIKEYRYYDFFVEFETVEELIDIIIREQTYFMSCALEKEADIEVPSFNDKISEILTQYDKKEIPFEELQYNLKTIIDSEMGNQGFFQYLREFLKMRKELAEQQ